MIFKSKFKIFCTSSNKKHCDENNIFSDTDIVTHNKSVKRLFGNCEPFDNVDTLNNSSDIVVLIQSHHTILTKRS